MGWGRVGGWEVAGAGARGAVETVEVKGVGCRHTHIKASCICERTVQC